MNSTLTNLTGYDQLILAQLDVAKMALRWGGPSS